MSDIPKELTPFSDLFSFVEKRNLAVQLAFRVHKMVYYSNINQEERQKMIGQFPRGKENNMTIDITESNKLILSALAQRDKTMLAGRKQILNQIIDNAFNKAIEYSKNTAFDALEHGKDFHTQIEKIYTTEFKTNGCSTVITVALEAFNKDMDEQLNSYYANQDACTNLSCATELMALSKNIITLINVYLELEKETWLDKIMHTFYSDLPNLLSFHNCDNLLPQDNARCYDEYKAVEECFANIQGEDFILSKQTTKSGIGYASYPDKRKDGIVTEDTMKYSSGLTVFRTKPTEFHELFDQEPVTLPSLLYDPRLNAEVPKHLLTDKGTINVTGQVFFDRKQEEKLRKATYTEATGGAKNAMFITLLLPFKYHAPSADTDGKIDLVLPHKNSLEFNVLYKNLQNLLLGLATSKSGKTISGVTYFCNWGDADGVLANGKLDFALNPSNDYSYASIEIECSHDIPLQDAVEGFIAAFE